jgi:peptidoglycan hydrolase CwlO-like protein
MGNFELAGTVKMLQGQRRQVQKELAKLDKAIAALRELNGTNSMPSQNGKGHTMSAAARRKIAKAQKARWAKVRQAQKAKG